MELLPPVLMIGHSNHSAARFVELLRQNGVRVLVDVREKPFSRWSPQFNREALRSTVEGSGIKYYHAPTLGGLNPLPTPKLRYHLEHWLPQPGICLMCAEGDFTKCHRHYLLAPIVRELGHPVLQILPDSSVVEDVPQPQGPVQASLF